MQPHELVRTLETLTRDDDTGALKLTSGSESFAILFDGGRVVGLTGAGTQAPDLVEMLRMLGRLPRARAAVLRRLTGRDADAAMLVMREWGIVSAEDAQRRAEFRISQAIARALGWERVEFEFDPSVPLPEGGPAAPERLEMQRMLPAAVAMVDEWAALARTVRPPLTRDSTARWLPDFSGDVAHLDLSGDEIHVLCLANGQFPVHAMAYALLLPEPAVARIIRRLIELRLVGLVDPD
jgi:hypothetical protein